MEHYEPLVLAVLVGLAITTQASFNTLLARHIGPVEMAFAIHVVGTTLMSLVLLLGFGRIDLTELPSP